MPENKTDRYCKRAKQLAESAEKYIEDCRRGLRYCAGEFEKVVSNTEDDAVKEEFVKYRKPLGRASLAFGGNDLFIQEDTARHNLLNFIKKRIGNLGEKTENAG
jgi:hypothetical protein